MQNMSSIKSYSVANTNNLSVPISMKNIKGLTNNVKKYDINEVDYSNLSDVETTINDNDLGTLNSQEASNESTNSDVKVDSKYTKSKDFYNQYRAAGYTEEQISKIQKYPSVEKYMPNKDANEYSDEANLHDTLKIENIPCSNEEKQHMQDLKNIINNNKKRLEGLYAARDAFKEEYAKQGAYGSPLKEEYYLPEGSSTYYYLPPGGVCKTTISVPSGIQYGTPVYDGKTTTVTIKNNYGVYAANVEIDANNLKEETEMYENLLLNYKKSLIVLSYEKVKNTVDYKNYIKDLDTDKRLNYHEEQVANITGIQYGTPVIDGTKIIKVVELSSYRLNNTEVYEHMTLDQKRIFCYYLDKYDRATADKYLDSIIEDVNYRIAKDKFEGYKNSLHLDNEEKLMDDLYNIGKIDQKAWEMGLGNWLVKIASPFADTSYTDSYMNQVYDYENLLLLDFIATQRPEWAKRYNLFEKIGELTLPVIATFAFAIGGEGTIAKNLYTILAGVGKAGEVMKENAQKGYSGIYLYLDGAGYGLSKYTVTSIVTTLLKKKFGVTTDIGTAFVTILSNVAGVFSTDALKATLDALLTGYPVDVTKFKSEDALNLLKAALLSAIVQGTGLVIKTIKGQKIWLDKTKVDEIGKNINSSRTKDVANIVISAINDTNSSLDLKVDGFSDMIGEIVVHVK